MQQIWFWVCQLLKMAGYDYFGDDFSMRLEMLFQKYPHDLDYEGYRDFERGGMYIVLTDLGLGKAQREYFNSEVEEMSRLTIVPCEFHLDKKGCKFFVKIGRCQTCKRFFDRN